MSNPSHSTPRGLIFATTPPRLPVRPSIMLLSFNGVLALFTSSQEHRSVFFVSSVMSVSLVMFVLHAYVHPAGCPERPHGLVWRCHDCLEVAFPGHSLRLRKTLADWSNNAGPSLPHEIRALNHRVAETYLSCCCPVVTPPRVSSDFVAALVNQAQAWLGSGRADSVYVQGHNKYRQMYGL